MLGNQGPQPPPQAPQGVSEEFQRVALCFDVLRSVPAPAAGEDCDGTRALRKACCEHIIAFLQGHAAFDHAWKNAQVAK